MAAPAGDVISPAYVLGGSLWIQHPWWDEDVSVSPSLLARFKAAHAPAAAAAGLSPEQVAAEAALFDAPAVWRLPGGPGGSTAQLPPDALWLAQACRLRVTKLPVEAVRAACAAADAFLQLSPQQQTFDEAAVAAALAPLAAHAPTDALTDALTFALNAPARSNAYVFCEPQNEVVVARSGLDLDVAALAAAKPRKVTKPTPAQRCMSRSVCLWCGASPFARGVTLRDCPGCACVAYCSSRTFCGARGELPRYGYCSLLAGSDASALFRYAAADGNTKPNHLAPKPVSREAGYGNRGMQCAARKGEMHKALKRICGR